MLHPSLLRCVYIVHLYFLYFPVISIYLSTTANYTLLSSVQYNMFPVWHIVVCYITGVAVAIVTIVKNVHLRSCWRLFAHK
jgi:hypothetical protein